MLKVLIHLVGFLLKASDFHLTRGDVPLEFLDLVVKYELELLELLRFLFQLVNLFLAITDQLVFSADLVGLVLDFPLEASKDLLLVGNLDVLLLLVTFQLLDVRLEVHVLILSEL